ncbi:MAG: hypothetical protein Q8R29_00380 [bacterium]|nr:hypothetical protein [bacterium]
MSVMIFGAYSILFHRDSDPQTLYAVDWDWGTHKKWSCSEKDEYGIRWDPTGTFDDIAYGVLLKHFGLQDWSDEFPPARVVNMPPKELAAERRKKERESGLPRLKMVSDTIGSHVPAEEYP